MAGLKLQRSTAAIGRILALDASSADRWFCIGLFGFTLLKLAALATSPLNLAPDEAHYWDWSKRLDWAYYSKGPIVALLIRAGTTVFGDTELGVRFPALLVTTLMHLVLYGFLRRLAGAPVALVCSVLLASGLLFHSLGLGMTTDPPVALFWALGLWMAYEAIFRRHERAWVGCGLSLGLATLSKYTAGIVLPAIVVYLWLNPRLRRQLAGRWPWLGVAAFGFCLMPLAWWNARHGWVNLAHNAGHIVDTSATSIELKYLPELIGAQFGLVGPVLLGLLLWSAWQGWRGYREKQDDVAGLLLAVAMPLVAVCVATALTKRVYANWPAPLYLNLIALLAYVGRPRIEELRRPIALALLVNSLILLPAYPLAMGYSLGMPADRLPTKKLVGWDRLGQRVDELVKTWESRGVPISFVTNNRYGRVSAIAFYAASRPRVYCTKVGERRMNQHDIWGGWARERGGNALIVLRTPEVPAMVAKHFESVEYAGEPLPIEIAGVALRTFYFHLGRKFDGRGPGRAESY